ncbi:KDO2-lipid IV(A) lauroyltransferase [Acinetobacter calcoaceticus]|uniref:KDO2-lipid IV(A) lauroyltransferase n=1 Tax=Acinetobacter calcoaceticus TaxID=471 RepID=A0A4R1Y7D1_ACICA|nr:KDO2-lipid IV(A) lauroyltransferase [Acinetobacter calcoaceticus]
MYFILKLIALIPLRILQTLACWIAVILYSFDSSMKRITQINIEIVYPELSKSEQQHLIKQSLKSQCRTYVEFLKSWGMPPEYSLSLLKNIIGEQILTESLENKKGVIVVVLHYGCWELLNSWLSLYTSPVIMYKPNKVKGFNRYILEARQKYNATLVPTDENGVRAIFKHLKQGGLTVILPDHLPKISGGVYADFYGKNALSSTLVSKLAAKTQCNILGVSCTRNTDLSSFDVHCRRLSEEILSKDTQQSVECLNQEIEKMINQDPVQYIWSYKRFRNISGQVNVYNKT